MSAKMYLIALILLIVFGARGQDNVVKLPHCRNSNKPGLILVTTLDGKLSALDTSGSLVWDFETGPGPLLTSNIHKLELTNNGQWIRIIPSLSGGLYKFDGTTVDAIPITAESLLKSSFRYSEDLVIAGGIEVRTYGVDLNKGDKMYECSPLGCKNVTENQELVEDVLVLERITQTIRAIEPRTGNERWNFSVGQHNIKLSQTSCINMDKGFDLNLSAIVPEGVLVANNLENNQELWQHKFPTPIVNVWKWNGVKLTRVDLFSSYRKTYGNSKIPSPAIYIGMHKKQLYIHESAIISRTLQSNANHVDFEVVESRSLRKFPWKPVTITRGALTPLEADDSTALSVLYGSEYVNGNGFYLYTVSDVERDNVLFCDNNTILDAEKSYEEYVMISIWYWWKEVLVISITTAIIVNVMCRSFENKRQNKQEVIYVERHVEVPVRIPFEEGDSKSDSKSRTSSESSVLPFTSRYINDFDTVSCLGKGGFGVVFEVKQKIDECCYAIKRITLPNEIKSRERVMREVKALAKLDHSNIVRYFNSWVECPPPGWQQEHDKNWAFNNSSNFGTTSYEPSQQKRWRSTSVVIELPEGEKFLNGGPANETNDSSSFIVFENSSSEDEKDTRSLVCKVTKNGATASQHQEMKSFWRQAAGQRPRSLDLSGAGCAAKLPLPQPVFLYIQMQLCQKESLRDWLKNNTERDFHYVLDTFRQIVSAVEYVHLQGLIHRDLKPSNIFFSLEGKVKVGDFGLVTDMQDCAVADNCSFSPTKGHTKAVGTRLYMSPEQVKGQQYNYKVDIYSLGLIFFELLVPFATEMERIDTLTNIKNKNYPERFRCEHAREFALLKMMLSTDPKERPTAIGIKARPPLAVGDTSCDNSEYHFELPKPRKFSE